MNALLAMVIDNQLVKGSTESDDTMDSSALREKRTALSLSRLLLCHLVTSDEEKRIKPGLDGATDATTSSTGAS